MSQQDDNFDEDCLPAHKRSGYAERLYEQSDFLRKEKREEELLKGNENERS